MSGVPRSSAPRTAPPTADATEVAGQLRLSVTRLARILRHQDPATLSATLSSALSTVHRCGPMTLGELAAKEVVTPPTITRVVDKLVFQGLVTRAADGRDGRIVRVEVTEAGRERVAESRSRRTAWLVERLQDLPDSDLACLAAAAEILTRLTEGGVADATATPGRR
jgi:DNA-binding MarR family transcriptional regulator